MCFSSWAVDRKSNRGAVVHLSGRAPLSLPAKLANSHFFYKALWTWGILCSWIVTLPLHTHTVLFLECFCIIPIASSSPAFLCVFPGHWIAAHTLSFMVPSLLPEWWRLDKTWVLNKDFGAWLMWPVNWQQLCEAGGGWELGTGDTQGGETSWRSPLRNSRGQQPQQHLNKDSSHLAGCKERQGTAQLLSASGNQETLCQSEKWIT